jgi:hypothetical protein
MWVVPVTFVAWAFGRRDTGEISAGLIANTFLTGGVLGVLGASVVESFLLRPSPWLFLGVGLIEEAAKLVALALLTRHLVHTPTCLGGDGVGGVNSPRRRRRTARVRSTTRPSWQPSGMRCAVRWPG